MITALCPEEALHGFFQNSTVSTLSTHLKHGFQQASGLAFS
jgi:hypothetical protein